MKVRITSNLNVFLFFSPSLLFEATLGARDFSSAVPGFCQVFIVTRALVASAYGRRCVGLRPTPKIPAAREKNLWYPGYFEAKIRTFPIDRQTTRKNKQQKRVLRNEVIFHLICW